MGGRTWLGDTPFAAWIRDLQAFDRMSVDTRERLRRLDEWNLLSPVNARKSASMFLADYARLMGAEAQQALKAAEDLYRKQAETLEPITRDSMGKQRNSESWTPAERDREIRALTVTRQLDAAAITAIERALAAAESGD
jgi:hypothetical protein